MRRLLPLGLAIAAAACSETSAPFAVNQAGDGDANDIARSDMPRARDAASDLPPAASRPDSIPNKFRGIWAEGRAACAQLSHPSRLIVSERVIRYPALVLIGENVDVPTDSSFAVEGYNQRTGAPAEAHFSIDATGLILTDEAGGGTVRTKCG